MQQRQLRLGDILDDYCPRERRVTNHAIVAMVGDAVKQTRCTTCDAEHEYKNATVPRQRRKNEAPAALYAHVAASAPKRVTHDPPAHAGPNEPLDDSHDDSHDDDLVEEPGEMESAEPGDATPTLHAASEPPPDADESEDDEPSGNRGGDDEGPFHRRLIRASLPRPEGQQPPARPIPEFTIRQPTGRPNRFRSRQRPGGGQGQQFGGNRSGGNMGGMRGPRPNAGRPGGGMNRRGQGGRKRSK